MRVLWIALIAAQLLFAVMVAVPLLPPSTTAPDDTTLVILISVATACAIASFLVPPILRRSALARHRIAVREVPDPAAPVGFRGVVPTIREYEDVAEVKRVARTTGLPGTGVSSSNVTTISLLPGRNRCPIAR